MEADGVVSGAAFLFTVALGVAIGLTLAGWSPGAHRAGRRIAEFIRWMAEGEPHEIRYVRPRTIPEPPRVRRIPARPRPYDWATDKETTR